MPERDLTRRAFGEGHTGRSLRTSGREAEGPGGTVVVTEDRRYESPNRGRGRSSKRQSVLATKVALSGD